MNKGTLYLIPVPLGADPAMAVLPATVCVRAQSLTHFVAENAKSARAVLKSLSTDTPLQKIEIRELNNQTPSGALPELLSPLRQGTNVGLLSEAGCPAVADPGSALVALAHHEGIRVVPLVGPSSILLALMASGLNGQSFAFHGYLPTEATARGKCLHDLEKSSLQERRTQIFIETPYRNRQMLDALLKTCSPTTTVCVATDLTLDSEQILSRPVAEWRRLALPDINRRPTVFLLQA